MDGRGQVAQLALHQALRSVARLFVALYPPREVAGALLEQLEALRLPPHRATPLEQVHMTLSFLGEVSDRDWPETAESVERGAAGVRAFELTPRALVTLPERSLARLVAATTDAPAALLELRARLVARLVTRRRKEAPFRPHMTLCRFRAPTRCALPASELSLPTFPVEAISLQRSILRPEGAEHRQVARVHLAG